MTQGYSRRFFQSSSRYYLAIKSFLVINKTKITYLKINHSSIAIERIFYFLYINEEFMDRFLQWKYAGSDNK